MKKYEQPNQLWHWLTVTALSLSLSLPGHGMTNAPTPVVLEPFQQRFDQVAPLQTLSVNSYDSQAKELGLIGACIVGGLVVIGGSLIGFELYKCWKRGEDRRTNGSPATNGNSVSLSFELGTTNHTISANTVCQDCGQVQAEITYHPDNTFTLRLDGGTNRFELQRSTNLVNWETVCQILAPNEHEFILQPKPALNNPQEFFQLISIP